jgi:mRNA-degrading endonuclease toxin of MazEF toxin-antitoxin module
MKSSSTLDQLRAVDWEGLVRELGRVSPKTAETVSTVLVEMFARQKLALR